tara:strand:+ start:1189 stop:1473 length:285 start_codon:yes stop_codon:yes gene_type:complete
MKQYLTEKNLMWASIVLLAALVLSSCGAKECCGEQAKRRGSMRPKMEMAQGMRGRMQSKRRGSEGDTGRGAWVRREALVDGEKKGRKRGPKESK